MQKNVVKFIWTNKCNNLTTQSVHIKCTDFFYTIYGGKMLLDIKYYPTNNLAIKPTRTAVEIPNTSTGPATVNIFAPTPIT